MHNITYLEYLYENGTIWYSSNRTEFNVTAFVLPVANITCVLQQQLQEQQQQEPQQMVGQAAELEG
jgi:hypothetical protein